MTDIMTPEQYAVAKAKIESLNALSDELNTRIDSVEEALRLVHFPVPAAVQVDETKWLRYGKFNNRWRLLIAVGDTEGPLRDEARTTRLYAIKHFDVLVAALINACDTEADQVSQRIGDCDRFIEHIKAVTQ